MNCQPIIESTVWPCARNEGDGGQEFLVVAPPVTFWDGSIVPLYVFDYGSHIQITDDGGLLQHLDASGFRLTEDTRRQSGLRRAIQQTGAIFTNELTVLCNKDKLRGGFSKALAALYAARHWEDENAGRPQDARLLIAEAEDYLRILRPSAVVRHDVQLRGITGKTYAFPLALDADVFDAVGPSPASSASATKRLFDVRSVRDQRDTPITIVVDDRSEADKVKQDISLLSQLAHVERFTQIRAQALAQTARH